MKDFSYKDQRQVRRDILSQYGHLDHIYFSGNNNVLISVPHGIVQTRLGKQKGAEIGTIPMGTYIKNNTNSHIIIKTKNNYDDANVDINCPYRKTIEKIIKQNNIKYLIDFHGLSRKTPCDVNLGTRLEQNILPDYTAFTNLLNALSKVFDVQIDYPFMASGNTISSTNSKKYGIFTLQVETNCGLTNTYKTIDKFNQLVKIFSDWINNFLKK